MKLILFETEIFCNIVVTVTFEFNVSLTSLMNKIINLFLTHTHKMVMYLYFYLNSCIQHTDFPHHAVFINTNMFECKALINRLTLISHNKQINSHTYTLKTDITEPEIESCKHKPSSPTRWHVCVCMSVCVIFSNISPPSEMIFRDISLPLK